MSRLSLILCLLLSPLCHAAVPDDALFDAIAQVESSGNAKARNATEDAVGIVQIRPGVVADVNRILKAERYTLADRYNVEKSRQMFRVYLDHYSEAAKRRGQRIDHELFARIWNGGPRGYTKTATISYWNKVKRELED